jgi:hypothetical protein
VLAEAVLQIFEDSGAWDPPSSAPRYYNTAGEGVDGVRRPKAEELSCLNFECGGGKESSWDEGLGVGVGFEETAFIQEKFENARVQS